MFKLNSRLIPESIPWLVSNDRKQEAEQILRKAAKKINITLPDNIFDEDHSMNSEMQRLFEKNAIVSDNCDGRIITPREVRLSDIDQQEANSNSTENNIESDRHKIGLSDPITIPIKVSSTDYLSKTEREAVTSAIPKYRFSDLMRSKTLRRYYLAFFPIWY